MEKLFLRKLVNTFSFCFIDVAQVIVQFSQIIAKYWTRDFCRFIFHFHFQGQNCGQDEVWHGAYDWLPCQHGRFVKVDDGNWINNTTFCGGKDSVCITDIIVTIPILSLPSPGVVKHDYPRSETPIWPQVSKRLEHILFVEFF